MFRSANGLLSLEAYVGARYTSTPQSARIGRILMARGRHAVDVALTTSFDLASLTPFTVWIDEVAVASQPPAAQGVRLGLRHLR